MRLASSGTDTHVVIWYVTCNDTIQVELAAVMKKHQRSVNVVRWSPSGEFLASGDDEHIIFLWYMKGEQDGGGNLFDDNDAQYKESWMVYKTLRGHLEDIYDLAWSPNSNQLLSGSVDNKAIVWDATAVRKTTIAILSDHKGFVQGVAWDPKGKYLATLSTDRYFRLFNTQTFKLFRRVSKARYPVDTDSPFYDKTFRLFHDDTLQTFYRRLCFSPDGELIFLPSGVIEDLTPNASISKPGNTTYIFTRYNTKTPAVILPAMDQYTVAVRCCPVLFTLRPHDANVRPMIAMPYRTVFAVATKNSVYLHDTQQKMPFGVIANIHYARLTDLAWSSDGMVLAVSSADGFCTLVSFEDGELGTAYTPAEDESDESDSESVNQSENKPAGGDGEAPEMGTIFKTEKFVVGEPMDGDDQPKTNAKSLKPIAGAITKIITSRSNSIEIQIPDTIIATTNQFEQPEYKTKPATPIAVRRVPRNSVASPSVTAGNSPSATVRRTGSGSETPTSTARKQKQAVRTSPPEQEEALDSWPKPINEAQSKVGDSKQTDKIEQVVDDTEDFHLFYDGDSESIMKPAVEKPSNENAETAIPIDLETVTPESKSAKTPRRVELRTLSTPKAKKNLFISK